jgi:Uma2 family endonuclease
MMLNRMRQITPGDRMTVVEFFEYAPEDRKAELINGVFVMPSPVSIVHQQIERFLVTLLSIFVKERDLGEILHSRVALDLGVEYQAYEPDILFVRRDRLSIIQEQKVAGAPDMVVEILSPGTKAIDRGIKRKVYGQVGVSELWLPDPAGIKTSRFYQRRSPTSDLTEVKFSDGILHSTTLPGFFVREAWLWPPDGQQPSEVAVLRELGVI